MSQAADLRRGISALSALAIRDLEVVWRSVHTAEQAKAALQDVLPALVDTYGAAAATLAADWYDEQRHKAEVKGRFTAIPADLKDTGTDELAGYAVGPLFKATPDWQSAKVLTAGGLQRRIANASRATITRSALADPKARGWQRDGFGACAFCAMLIGRGAVYSEASADFAAHDHCNCVAVPAFGNHAPPVQPYTPTNRKITDADRARVRGWIAANL